MTSDHDPVRFRIETSHDGDSWSEVDRPLLLYSSSLFLVSVNRSIQKSIDLGPTLEWVLRWCASWFCLSAGNFLAAGLGLAGRGRSGTKSVVFFLVVNFCLMVIVAFDNGISASRGQQRLAHSHWLMSISYALLATALWYERYAIFCIPICYIIISISLLPAEMWENLLYFDNNNWQIGVIVPLISST